MHLHTNLWMRFITIKLLNEAPLTFGNSCRKSTVGGRHTHRELAQRTSNMPNFFSTYIEMAMHFNVKHFLSAEQNENENRKHPVFFQIPFLLINIYHICFFLQSSRAHKIPLCAVWIKWSPKWNWLCETCVVCLLSHRIASHRHHHCQCTLYVWRLKLTRQSTHNQLTIDTLLVVDCGVCNYPLRSKKTNFKSNVITDTFAHAQRANERNDISLIGWAVWSAHSQHN